MRSRALVTAAAFAALLAVPAMAQESTDPRIEGVEIYEDLSYDHVSGPIDYDLLPPAGGPHSPMWQNCGVYDEPIRDENAVHSMEHGAVWVTYKQGLPADQVEKLADKVKGQDYMLMSPVPGLDKNVSLQAWGYQLKVDSVNDPRIDAFIKALRLNASVEPGAACSSGVTATGNTPQDS